MMKNPFLFLFFLVFTNSCISQTTKILFDATKAETAGNADWVLDADLNNLGYPSSNNGKPIIGGGSESNPQNIPTQAQSGITTSTIETYWKGGLSAWGIDCVKKNYIVETLAFNDSITYGDMNNPQDLANYKVFIVCEPNILFTAAEKVAMLNFVQNGGGLFMVGSHTISDRNNDGHDSPEIWNDFMNNNGMVTNPFGINFELQNISDVSYNMSASPTDSLLYGAMGTVTKLQWFNGTYMTINPTVNSSVKASAYTSFAQLGNVFVLVASSRYGLGKIVAIGDSSPCDDGTGDVNDNLYNGYTGDVSRSHQKLLMNATIWLATVDQALPVNISSFYVNQKNENVQISWQNETESGIRLYEIQVSNNGTDYNTIDHVNPTKNNNSRADYSITSSIETFFTPIVYFRLKTIEENGKAVYSSVKKIEIAQTPFSIYLSNTTSPDKIEAHIRLSKEALVDFSIYNVDGKQMLHQERTVSAGFQSILFPTQKLQKGLYYLSARNKDVNKTIPFVK